ncbi:hypothetical protein IF1G_08507 [Cordyceps javanica]|uniref:Uncharacterized protein n=1 Tax=Cordyceps javanica TaxID=43265 RepID=A0A545UT03_9HYPO|nr:hypothetical protein IF1G_08507 [Cordyceps javanica]
MGKLPYSTAMADFLLIETADNTGEEGCPNKPSLEGPCSRKRRSRSAKLCTCCDCRRACASAHQDWASPLCQLGVCLLTQ